jgi:hypothetical protein
MNSTPQSSSAAGEHYADAERILAALPLVKRRADADRHVQVALVHAVLSVAAILADTDEQSRPKGNPTSAPCRLIRAGRFLCADCEP